MQLTVNGVYFNWIPVQTKSPAPRLNPSAESIGFEHLKIRFLVSSVDSGGSVAAFELAVEPARSLPAPAHSHDHYDETIFGLEGVITFTVDGQPFDIGPGQTLCIPRGAVHRFDNRGGVEARCLCVVTPAALGPDYFREVAAVFAAAEGRPPDRARLGEIMRRHGLTPAPPPSQG